jgi:hypothetical protein
MTDASSLARLDRKPVRIVKAIEQAGKQVRVHHGFMLRLHA